MNIHAVNGCLLIHSQKPTTKASKLLDDKAIWERSLEVKNILTSTASLTTGAQSYHPSLLFPRSSLWLSSNEETAPNYQDIFLTQYTGDSFSLEAD